MIFVRPQETARFSASWVASPHLAFVAAIMVVQLGCGSIREQRATDQMLLSDAVDRSVANIDFSPLNHEKVFLDSRFLQFKKDSAVTTNYVISSLRQQMVVAGCLLQDQTMDADYVVEVRVGTMASDGHDINYGIPPTSSVNATASIISGAPTLPAFPEISLARRMQDMAAVKIAAFAYDRKTRLPVWQSGLSLARSESTGTWVLGAGPFKRGSIYKGTQFAGQRAVLTRFPKLFKDYDDLDNNDYVYRGTTIWDTKLREKMESSKYVASPNAEPVGEVKKESVEVADKTDSIPPRDAVR